MTNSKDVTGSWDKFPRFLNVDIEVRKRMFSWSDYTAEEIAAGTNMKSDGTHTWLEMVDRKNIFATAESLSP